MRGAILFMRDAILFMRDAIFRVLSLTVLHILKHKLHLFLKHDFFIFLFIYSWNFKMQQIHFTSKYTRQELGTKFYK